MDVRLIERMLNASELFYYSQRFRAKLFILVVDSLQTFKELFLDLHIISDSHIRLAVIVNDPAGIEEEISAQNSYDDFLRLLSFDSAEFDADMLNKDIRKIFSRNHLPILTCKTALTSEEVVSSAYRLGVKAKAEKVVFAGMTQVLHHAGKKIHRVNPADINKPGFKPGKLQALILNRALETKIDSVIIEPVSGQLYLEIFTHVGSGTLISVHQREVFRHARAEDINEIYYLMLPYIQENKILPVHRREIMETLKDYYVLTFDNSVIATLKITDYGEAVEIGKLCTLPRYRGEGLTEELIKRVFAEIRSKYKYAFALTINPAAAQLFIEIGFKSEQRENLPQDWQKHYDFTRPSMGFIYHF